MLADPQFLVSDFKEMLEHLREKDLQEYAIEEIAVIYNEILYLKFVSDKVFKNFMLDKKLYIVKYSITIYYYCWEQCIKFYILRLQFNKLQKKTLYLRAIFI